MECEHLSDRNIACPTLNLTLRNAKKKKKLFSGKVNLFLHLMVPRKFSQLLLMCRKYFNTENVEKCLPGP